MDFTLWFEIILFFMMIVLSGFFSSSETALFSLSDIQLEKMHKDRNPRTGLIKRMLSEPRRLIITILIGNEFVNVTASVISATIVIRLFGAENKLINLFIMVPLLLLFGEITPKTLAIRHNVSFATYESRLIELFAGMIKPLRWLVRSVADRLITLIIGKERSRGNIITEDMVRSLTREAVGEGTLDHLEAQLINRIFEFGDKKLEDIMTPRSFIFFLPAHMPVQDMIKEFYRTRYTKIPVYKDNKDRVVGILHARDLLDIDNQKTSQETISLEKFLRKPYFVPETKPAADLFRTFRERKISMALTVDEYGGVTGMVAMEDLLECIFGQIYSRSELHRKVSIKDLGEGQYVVNGMMPVTKFNQEMGTQFSKKWSETIGGLLLYHYGELPIEGATIEMDGFKFTATDVTDNRIKVIHFEEIQNLGSFASSADGDGSTDKLEDSTVPAPNSKREK